MARVTGSRNRRNRSTSNTSFQTVKQYRGGQVQESRRNNDKKEYTRPQAPDTETILKGVKTPELSRLLDIVQTELKSRKDSGSILEDALKEWKLKNKL